MKKKILKNIFSFFLFCTSISSCHNNEQSISVTKTLVLNRQRLLAYCRHCLRHVLIKNFFNKTQKWNTKQHISYIYILLQFYNRNI